MTSLRSLFMASVFATLALPAIAAGPHQVIDANGSVVAEVFGNGNVNNVIRNINGVVVSFGVTAAGFDNNTGPYSLFGEWFASTDCTGQGYFMSLPLPAPAVPVGASNGGTTTLSYAKGAPTQITMNSNKNVVGSCSTTTDSVDLFSAVGTATFTYVTPFSVQW